MSKEMNGDNKSKGNGYSKANKISPSAIEKYLKGVDFPSNKEELIEHAKNNSAPDNVLQAISNFSDKEYVSLTDISKEIKKSE